MINGWKIYKEEIAYNGFFKLLKYKLSHKLFNGGWMPGIERELFERGEAAAVLPFDPTINKVLLVEQFRIGALNEETPWLIELIAGVIEPGEQAKSVVCREALEEAGIHIENPTPICSYLSSPGASTEKLHVFYAEADLSEAQGIHGLAEEGEDIRVCLYSPDVLFEQIDNDKINNAMTLIGLQWFRRYYENNYAKNLK